MGTCNLGVEVEGPPLECYKISSIIQDIHSGFLKRLGNLFRVYKLCIYHVTSSHFKMHLILEEVGYMKKLLLVDISNFY